MIKLTDVYYFDSDSMNYILMEKDVIKKEDSKNFGKDTFYTLGYYGTLEQLKRAIVEREIKADLELLNNIDKVIKLKESIGDIK